MMVRYRNASGNSGVDSYQIGDNYITIKFSGTFRSYTYSYNKAGRAHVEKMKSLAKQGSGLNSYVNNYVKFSYD